ncbi:hypothetical protein ACJ41O_012185 [Fusarium nematophilum]
MVLTYDPEFGEAIAAYDGPVPSGFGTVAELKEVTEIIMKEQFRVIQTPAHIIQTRIPFNNHDGARLHLVRFAKEEDIQNSTAQPAVLYVHGGGGVACSVEIYAPMMAYLADYMGLPFFAAEYRLATGEPSSSYAADDVFSGLKFLSENAQSWNVDPHRIIIMGDSAGGGIAAGAALLARDRLLSPPLAKQILVYPMLDDRAKAHNNASWHELLLWSENDNDLCWKAILGEDKAGKEDSDVSIYAAPGRATDLARLPPTYIDVGGLDLFLHEDMAFAAKLAAADVEVELHVWPGLPHGFESARHVSWVDKALEARKSALRRLKAGGS